MRLAELLCAESPGGRPHGPWAHSVTQRLFLSWLPSGTPPSVPTLGCLGRRRGVAEQALQGPPGLLPAPASAAVLLLALRLWGREGGRGCPQIRKSQPNDVTQQTSSSESASGPAASHRCRELVTDLPGQSLGQPRPAGGRLSMRHWQLTSC